MQAPTTYEDSSRALTSQARTALLKQAAQDWTAARNAADEAGKLELAALNHLRDCGSRLRQAADHESISLEFFHSVQEYFPDTMTFAAARFCVSLSRSFTEPIKSLPEARMARRKLFEAFGVEAAPRRLEAQQGHKHNPWSEFVSSVASVTSIFEHLETEPMEKWSKEKLNTFVRTTQPIAEQHQKAVALLR